jgi:hypothetical protein
MSDIPSRLLRTTLQGRLEPAAPSGCAQLPRALSFHEDCQIPQQQCQGLPSTRRSIRQNVEAISESIRDGLLLAERRQRQPLVRLGFRQH